jgi:hypothetical protein
MKIREHIIRPMFAPMSRVLQQARASKSLLPGLRRKPKLVARWLLTARNAYIALAAVIVFLALVHPHARDAFLDAIGPRESLGQKIKDVFGESDRSAFHRRGTIVLDMVARVAGGGAVLLLLFAHLPIAVQRAAAASSRRKRAAEDVGARDASVQATIRLETTQPPVPSGAGEMRATRADGLVAGRYVISTRIGRGGYGVVFRADDTVLQRSVALKQLPLGDDATAVARFQREARVLAMLSHPHIVQVFDLVEHDGYLWMAMELVEQGDLATHIKQHGPLPIAEAVFLAARIGEALDYAHGRGVIHRDLKPHNVLMADARTPKVTDFGLAKLATGTAHTVDGEVMGSPHYLSPEQADGRPVDGRTDIYALGIMLHQMIAGSVPFMGEFATVLAQHARREAPALSSRTAGEPVPAELDDLVTRMLAKSPDDRPSQMAAVVAALDGISQSRASHR